MVYIIYNLSVALKMYRVWLRGKLSKKTWREVVLMKEIKSLPKKMNARLVFFLSIILFKCVLWLGNIFCVSCRKKTVLLCKILRGFLPPFLPSPLIIDWLIGGKGLPVSKVDIKFMAVFCPSFPTASKAECITFTGFWYLAWH